MNLNLTINDYGAKRKYNYKNFFVIYIFHIIYLSLQKLPYSPSIFYEAIHSRNTHMFSIYIIQQLSSNATVNYLITISLLIYNPLILTRHASPHIIHTIIVIISIRKKKDWRGARQTRKTPAIR